MTIVIGLVATAVLLLVIAARGIRRQRAAQWQPTPGRYAAAVVVPAPRRRVRENVPHLLYGYNWIVGGRCYFGISNEPETRDARHGDDPRDQWWYRRSTQVMHPIAWYPNRTAARAAERAIIQKESGRGAYLANNHHNVRRPVRAHR